MTANIVDMLKDDALHNPCPMQRLLAHAAADEIVRLRADIEHEREQSDEWAKTLDAIDAQHTSFTEDGEQFCHECVGAWPCRTHSLIHPKEEA